MGYTRTYFVLLKIEFQEILVLMLHLIYDLDQLSALTTLPVWAALCSGVSPAVFISLTDAPF